MKEGIQKVALVTGRVGCYYLTALEFAERRGAKSLNPLTLFPIFLENKWIGEDAMMLRPHLILGYILGGKWEVFKAGPGHELPMDYVLREGEGEALRWERPLRVGEPRSAETAHFNLGSGMGPFDRSRIAWDSFPGSEAVTMGELVSRRIFRPIRSIR